VTEMMTVDPVEYAMVTEMMTVGAMVKYLFLVSFHPLYICYVLYNKIILLINHQLILSGKVFI